MESDIAQPIEIRIREGSNKTVVSTLLNSNYSNHNLGSSSRKIVSPFAYSNSVVRPLFDVSLNSERKQIGAKKLSTPS